MQCCVGAATAPYCVAVALTDASIRGRMGPSKMGGVPLPAGKDANASCLFDVSSSNIRPINRFQQLRKTQQARREGSMRPTVAARLLAALICACPNARTRNAGTVAGRSALCLLNSRLGRA